MGLTVTFIKKLLGDQCLSLLDNDEYYHSFRQKPYSMAKSGSSQSYYFCSNIAQSHPY
jgi:hypothetical protein